MFADEMPYRRVKDSGVLTAASFAALYGLDPRQVRFCERDQARAFKFSVPRPTPQGNPGDGDMHGGQ